MNIAGILLTTGYVEYSAHPLHPVSRTRFFAPIHLAAARQLHSGRRFLLYLLFQEPSPIAANASRDPQAILYESAGRPAAQLESLIQSGTNPRWKNTGPSST